MQNRPAFAIYDASAGAGKTYTLVREYLAIILTSPREDAYRNILAITFTNKAVHEMKSRVVNTLSAFAAEETPPKFLIMMRDLAERTGMSVSEIRAKSKKIIRHIIHNYAAFDISTIDKFTHRVIRTFAHDLNLPVTFEVSLDTENLLAEAVDALIAQAGDDPQLTRLLVDFAMEKTDDDKSWDITRELLDTGKLILNENNRNEIVHFRNRTIETFMEVKAKIKKDCAEAEARAISLARETLNRIDQHGIEHQSFYSAYVPKHLQKIARGEVCFHAKIIEGYLRGDNCKKYSAATSPGQKQLIDAIADSIADAIHDINTLSGQIAFYQAFLKNITPLSLLNTVEKELASIQEEQNILSIAEFNRLINDQIRDQPAPFIYERLGEKYRHFFIDEFQDTSELQWQNLIPLIDNATSSEIDGQKGTLMIVGDPKQSIYRWRGGKAEQFIELANGHNPFNNKEQELYSLDTNYRSYSEVIQFNNAFFKMLARHFENPDYQHLYEHKTFQKPNAKTGGYVNISFIPPVGEDEDSPDKTAAHVKRTLEIIEEVRGKGFRYADIAILTRTRDQGIAVASALTEHKIQIISSETLQIANASEVMFIIDLLRFINNGRDRESKAKALQYLADGQQMLEVHDFIEAGLQQTTPEAFDAWLASLGIAFSSDAIRKKGLYEAVESIIAAFISDKNNAYLQFFLDIVLERDVKGMAGVADFLEFWDRSGAKFSIPTPEGEDAVRIMTIHKAKGLEFPVVILPFAEGTIGGKNRDKLWVEADQDVFGIPKVLIDSVSAVEQYGDAAAALYRQKKQEVLLDTINVLYVALTRAEEQLYIVSAMNLTTKNELPKNNVCRFFIEFLAETAGFNREVMSYDFGVPEKVSEVKALAEPSDKIKSAQTVLPPSAIAIARRESAMWGTPQQQAIEYGNAVHDIMARVSLPADVGAAIQDAIDQGVISEDQRAVVTGTLELIVGHPELQDHFNPTARVLNEQAIITGSGILKPDRVTIIDNTAYLLDYKTGARDAKHVAQLEDYARAIGDIGYVVAKKSLVYLGADVNVINL